MSEANEFAELHVRNHELGAHAGIDTRLGDIAGRVEAHIAEHELMLAEIASLRTELAEHRHEEHTEPESPSEEEVEPAEPEPPPAEEPVALIAPRQTHPLLRRVGTRR